MILKKINYETNVIFEIFSNKLFGLCFPINTKCHPAFSVYDTPKYPQCSISSRRVLDNIVEMIDLDPVEND